MRDNPGLEDASELSVTFGGRQEWIVLVAARNVHCYLPVGGRGGVLVNLSIPANKVPL